MDIKSEVLAIIDDLFMEDVSDMMDEDLFDAGVLDSMGTVELIVELESHFDINIPGMTIKSKSKTLLKRVTISIIINTFKKIIML